VAVLGFRSAPESAHQMVLSSAVVSVPALERHWVHHLAPE
jgi:hypothetical protein